MNLISVMSCDTTHAIASPTKGVPMPREKKMSNERTILSMPPDLKERIRKFRFANEINTEAEAMRILLERGLEVSEKSQQPSRKK